MTLKGLNEGKHIEEENKEEFDFYEYLETKNIGSCFEGENGIKKLNTICSDLGYEEERFLYGSPLELFLADNPGCAEVILDWIQKNLSDEQKGNLRKS
jgi:hypothetical protein